MIFIRITLNDGRKFFINENRKAIVLVDSIDDAFKYQTTLEFKVTWNLMDVMKEDSYYFDYELKENVIKFESIDAYTVDIKSFNINENEIEIGKDIYVDTVTFKRLMRCGITCSHWLYNNKKWVAFPKEDDYNKITKIKYYNRGLVDTIESHNNWGCRYDSRSWHDCYQWHHKCMLNPIIQQICLLGFDSCHEFMVYEKKVN